VAIVCFTGSRAAASRALVWWSVATEGPQVAPGYTWQPRGTTGRAMSGPRTTESWMVTLGGMNPFDYPLTANQLQKLVHPVLETASAPRA
jgi:hypothetical protein